MRHSTYKAIRNTLKPGDVLAWGGPGPVSAGIKFATRSNVSHVSIVLHTMCVGGMDPIVSMIESTSLGDGDSGVNIVRVSTAVKKYEGEVWVLPLRDDVFKELHIVDFTSWLIKQDGKKYDTPQAIMSAIDGPVPDSPEDFSKLFCSELDTGALKKGRLFESDLVRPLLIEAEFDPYDMNASEMTPADVCKFNIYNETVQIKGRSLELLK
jgi:hypothetical protein